MLRRAGRGAAGLVHAVIGLALAAALVTIAAAGALAWRLGERPLDVTWLAERLERHVAPKGTVVRIGRATVAWAGFHAGLNAPFQVALSGVQVQAPGQDAAVHAAEFAIDLSMGRLLIGRIVPRTVALSDVQIHLRHEADGKLGVDFGGSPPEPDAAIADVTRRPQSDAGTSASPLSQLRKVSVHGLQIDVADRRLGAAWQARDVSIDLDRAAGGGATGVAALTWSAGEFTTRIDANASLAEDAGFTRIHATATPISTAALAHALGEPAILDAPITPTLSAEFGSGFTLIHVALHVEAGAGTVMLPAKGGAASPASFASATLDADGNRSGGALQSLTMVLASPSGGDPTTLRATGTLIRAKGRLHAPLTLTFDHAAFADLPKLWPPGTGGGARPWLTENVTAGTAHDGHFTLTLDAAENLSDLDLTEAGGSLVGDDLTVPWLRPVPPMEHGHAVLTLQSRDALEITATARQGGIRLRQGTMRITGLSVHDQVGLINADLAGPLADMVTLLKHPRLGLLSAHPIPLNQPTGDVAGHLTVQLPLEDKVDFDSVAIHATTRITDAHLSGSLAGRSLDHGALMLDATNDGMKLTGTANLAGLPSSLAVDMDFRNGPPSQVLQHAAVSARGTDRQLAAAGLDAAGILAGTVAAQIDYTARRNGQADVKLDATLDDAAITTPFGWSKPAGTAGAAHAHVLLDHDRLVGIEDLQADAPGLTIRSRTEIVNGRPAVLHLTDVVIGRTRAAGDIRFPQHDGETLSATLTGPQLDLSGRLDAKPTSKQDQAPGAPKTPYAVDLRFDRVLMAAGAVIGPVALQAENDGRNFVRMQLASTGPEQFRASITPTDARRRVTADVGDVGTLLRGLAVTKDVNGGTMNFSGAFDDSKAGSPLAGEIAMTSLRIGGAAVFGKVLQGLTLYGLVDALRGPGLVFDRVTIPIRLEGGVLTLSNARAFSSSLGVTTEGTVDLGHDTADLRGTIVPAYALNTLPGRIPLIGRLFSPEPGGGVFATTYRVHGPLKDLSIGVNPLATLTPGALRGLFGIFD